MFAGTHAYFSMEENRTCSVNYFCFGAILIFIGSILLCALGFTVVLPFEATKLWYNTSCTVIAAGINDSICACDEEQLSGYPGCATHYPCLQIYVTFERQDITSMLNNNISDFNETLMINEKWGKLRTPTKKLSKQLHKLTVNTTYNTHVKRHINFRHKPNYDKNYGYYEKLRGNQKDNKNDHITTTSSPVFKSDKLQSGDYYDEKYQKALLYRSWSDIFYTYCSLQECGDQEWNLKETRRFSMKYGRVGKSFNCFVNHLDPQVVILNKTSFWAMLHAVLWPSTCLFVGVTLWIGLCCGCWRIDNENTDYSVPYYGVL